MSTTAIQPAFNFSATIQQQFEDFHRENPRVFELLVRFALEAKRAGRRKYGINAVFERVRWSLQIETYDAASEFKLNNNYRSRYARLIMREVHELSDFFETRELKA